MLGVPYLRQCMSLTSLCTHTNLSIISTVQSFVELVQYILRQSIFWVNGSHKIHSKTFLMSNNKEGELENIQMLPNFANDTQAIRLINSVCANVKGNCRGRKQCIDMEDNSSLPKCRRIRNKGDKENKNPLVHDKTVSLSPLQQVVSPLVSKPVQQVISLPISTSVQQAISPPISKSSQQVI